METFNENLLTPLFSSKNTEDEKNDCVEFLNQLEGWKTKCKNLHWSSPKLNIHVKLDEFGNSLSSYQDSLAEGYMGINGKLPPNILKGISCEATNALDFIEEVRRNTINFYKKLPQDVMYKGITSDCETFIQEINKYVYLFKLCDVTAYL